MNQLLKQILLIYVCVFALTGHALADPLADATKAAKLYRLLAEQGNAYAQYNLGWMYEQGEGVPQDYKEAVRWYRLAAEQGDALSQAFLGSMYNEGKGVPQDYKEALKWYRLAAAQGNTYAQYNLGVGYYLGQGVPQDYVLAHMWINIAAANAGGNRKTLLAAAIEERNSLAKNMTADQIAEAQELARKCTRNKFKGC